jgi:TRAP-type C4-dicarboxylate transport system permease small subunit
MAGGNTSAPGGQVTPDPGELRLIDADIDASEASASPVATPLQRLSLALGSAALLAAMATDAIAVAGRHAGIALLGSIEIVQACIVVVATSAMVAATVMGAHARVLILMEKVDAATAALLDRLADATSALVFLWLAAGSIWLASDLWSGVEITELLNIPLRWLRLVWIIGALTIAALFAVRACKRPKR